MNRTVIVPINVEIMCRSAQLSGELKEIEQKIGELVDLLPQARHQYPQLVRLDQSEDERLTAADQLSSQQNNAIGSPIINYINIRGVRFCPAKTS